MSADNQDPVEIMVRGAAWGNECRWRVQVDGPSCICKDFCRGECVSDISRDDMRDALAALRASGRKIVPQCEIDIGRLEEIATEYDGFDPTLKLGRVYGTMTMAEFSELLRIALAAVGSDWMPLPSPPSEVKP